MKRAAFQILLAKLRPVSKRSEPCLAVFSSGSSLGQGPPGRNGFLHSGQVTFLRPHVHVLLLDRHQRIAVRTDVADRHAVVLRLGGHVHHDETQGVGAVAFDDVERIDAVALALGHRLAEAVEDLRMDVDVVERHLLAVEQAR